MASGNSEDAEIGSDYGQYCLEDIPAAQANRFEFGKGYDVSFFQDIREKYQGRKNNNRRRTQHPTLVQGVPRYPTRPALWLDFKKRKGTCSSRRTSIHDIKTKTAIEDGMDHFTLSASKNTKEWSTDVGGYENLANEFMQTPECHAAVDTWTSIVRKHQLAREKDPEWIAHHKESEIQRKKKRVETMYGKSLGRSTSIWTEAATAIASHQNNGFEMIRDLDGDVARFSTPSPNEHDVLLESRDPGHQQVLPDVHEENGSHPETWPKNFQSAGTDILDSVRPYLGSEQSVSNITTRPMATCVAIYGCDSSRPNFSSPSGELVGPTTTTVPNASGSDGYASARGNVPRN
ncbi:uncharacterized protein LOC123466330 isoform X1 [Daphnia magna]|uniref:uncharacterized protein LOC123466330 isoform X1 n=1 Tax=Daphnia magna TaxID=35525 RepID=UPI001E1BB37A|nr:uncharacterized protein LOC123466330 isoform X1 [Daphnia magna]